MVTQQTLKELRKSLPVRFNRFLYEYEITRFVENSMRRQGYFFSNVYDDNKCANIYEDAMHHLEQEIATEYKKIAEVINEYIDGLNGEIEIDHSYRESNISTLTHVAVGAGIGLGAAILLGGPIAWGAGIGAVVFGLINSNEKKKELIGRIQQSASRINKEAIGKIEAILDTYIIPDALLLPPPTERIGRVQKEKPIEVLTPQQTAIKRFLDDRGIKYLLHFTDEKSYSSIMRNGICSVKEARTRGIRINVNDNGISAHRAERYMKSTSDDYISLTITNINESVLVAFKARRGIKNVKRILIDASILWKEIGRDRIYCNMNASSGSLECGSDLASLEAMFAPYVEQIKYTGERVSFNRVGKPRNIPTHNQAEILFQGMVEPKYFVGE